MSARPPELDAAARAMVQANADFVLIGGFAVIANRFVRATEDIDLLVPDDPDNDRRVLSALTSLGGVRLRDGQPVCEEHIIGSEHLRASPRPTPDRSDSRTRLLTQQRRQHGASNGGLHVGGHALVDGLATTAPARRLLWSLLGHDGLLLEGPESLPDAV